VSYEGGNTVHSETDAHPYGTGIEKYPVLQCNKNWTVSRPYNSLPRNLFNLYISFISFRLFLL